MKLFHIRNEGDMEEGIEMVVKLVKSKKKIKSFSIFVPSKRFASIFIANMERELNYHNIVNYNPKLELNIYIDEKGTSTDEE